MKGFFFTKKEPPPEKKKQAGGKTGCAGCGLDQSCVSPKMPVTGDGGWKVLIVAEAPGRAEDERGVQLIGAAGQLLRGILREIDIDLDRDCWKTNAVICRPPKNRTPSGKEIKACRSRLFDTIRELKPERIVLLGKTAIESYFGEIESVTGMEKWTGWAIPDRRTFATVFPTYHPSYLLRDEKNHALRSVFKKHLKRAFYGEEGQMWGGADIEIIQEEERAIEFLNETSQARPDLLAFDFETNSLRPYHEGSRIICVAMAWDDRCGVFPIFDGHGFQKALRRVLQGRIGKVAQNIKFEATWCRTVLGYEVRNWAWDTMLTTHVLDNRGGITGLKFQAFVRYGVQGYDKEVSPFLVSKGGPFNRVEECDQDKLMEYCGMDAALTLRLCRDQIREIDGTILEVGNELLLQGTEELSVVEGAGIAVDVPYFQKQQTHINRRVERLTREILDCPEAQKWKKETGKELNPSSDSQLKKLLFDILKLKPGKLTVKGNASTDQETLEQIDLPFTQKIVLMRKLRKLSSTYISNYIDGEIGGRIYPFFNLNRVKTYRSSSDSPNFQNIPKRDEEAQKIIRRGIRPSPGNVFLEVDYSGIEVRIGACYHKDREMLRYINDPATDMHRDMAMKIFMEGEKHISKHPHLRQAAKNGFVFPQFYGDYFVNCANNIWGGWLKADDKARMKEHGIRTLRQFEEHIKKIEDDFWFKKFTGYSEWKRRTWTEYQRNGYVELLTGFRCGGLMKKNDALNYPIQGAAFHCLLWSLIQINRMLRKEKARTRIVGQIHDSILFDADPGELEAGILPSVKRIMCDDIREEWPWIIVPLDIDAEMSEVNGNWYQKKKVKI